jgi:hypothetical protein
MKENIFFKKYFLGGFAGGPLSKVFPKNAPKKEKNA